MLRQTNPVAWIVLHFGPVVIVPLVTHALHRVIGIDAAAAVTYFIILITIAIGEAYLLRSILPRSGQWAWRTACGAAAGLAGGLVVMSTVDLRGYDAIATVAGMATAGLIIGLIQAPGQPLGMLRWLVPTLVGWVGGALVFRTVIRTLAGLSLREFKPYELAYNAGHNELLWFSVGLACQGVATAWAVAALSRRELQKSERGSTGASPAFSTSKKFP